jgi:hypothetical protein
MAHGQLGETVMSSITDEVLAGWVQLAIQKDPNPEGETVFPGGRAITVVTEPQFIPQVAETTLVVVV